MFAFLAFVVGSQASDPTSYPQKNGLVVTNLWLHSLNADERESEGDWASLPFANSNYGRTSLIYGNKVYVAESRPTIVEEQGEPITYYYATLHVIDALTGTFEKSVTLTDNGQPVKTPMPVSFSQIGVDDYGNFWGCGYTANCHNMPLRPYVIDLETGAVTYVGECALPDAEETAAGRVNYMDVVGDITSLQADGILMAAPSIAGSLCVYRWRRAQGSDEWLGDFPDNKVAKIMSETYPSGLSEWGGATVLKIVDVPYGEYFYIDDFISVPVLYNASGGTAVDGFQNRTDLAPKTGPNGVEEFSIGSHKMLAWVYNQYDVSYDADIAPSGGCVIKVGELGTDSNFSDLQEYWTLPKEGLGMTSDGGNRIHNISTQKVTDNSGKEGVLLLTHKVRNGIGVYLVAEDGFNASDITIDDPLPPTPPTTPSSPVFSPLPGEYERSVDVTLIAETGAVIYYTTDGSAPTVNSNKYNKALRFSVSAGMSATITIKAIAVKDYLVSDVASATYTLFNNDVPPTVSEAAHDPASYQLKNGLSVTNLWLRSMNADERENKSSWNSSPFANSNYCRTSLIYGNKVYVAESRPTVVEEGGEPKTYNYATLHEFDLVSGNFIKSTTLTNDGSPIVSPSPLCFNQIGVDNYGNVWGCGFTSNAYNAPLRPYVIDLESGAVTYQGECLVPDAEETAAGRIDYMDVVGDITGRQANGILMAAPSNAETVYAYRWNRNQGTDEWVGGFTDHKVAKALNGTYPTGLSKWGGATVLKIVESTSNSAEEFYIDDFVSNPVRYNVSGTAVDGFQNCTELAPNVGCNGFEYFTIANHNMLAWVYNQYDRSYDVNIAPSGGCVIKVGELGSNSQFSDLHEYWTLPKEGLGMTSDGGCRIHNISTQKVTDNSGKEGVLLLTHKGRNGIGVYLVAEDGFDVSNIILPSPYPEPDAPTFSPESGEYEEYVDVTISAEEDAEIRYTLDGTDPNENSALYTNPISFYEIGSTNVVKAVAIKHGLLSDVATATYTIIEASEPSSANLKVIMEMTNKENLVTSSDGRFSTGYGDYIYINDKANGKVVRYDKAGARSDYAEVAGIGTGITSDDVGNILVNKGFGTASSAVNWVIIEPDGTQHELTLTYPDAVAAARVDVAGRVVGDMMSNIGAYLFLAVSNASKIVAFKIAEGKQDGDAFESPTAQYAFDSTTFAQPRYATVDEIDAAIDPSTAVVYRRRVNVNVYGWNEEGTEIVDFGKPEGASTCEGFDIFKIGDIYYSVEPSTDASYADGFAIRELGKTENIVTKDKVLYAGGSQRFQSLTARVFDNTYAIIYQNVSGEGIGMYKFTPAGTGVNTIAAEGEVVATAYYNLQGIRVNNPAAGQILIKVNTLSNGKVSASKIIVR